MQPGRSLSIDEAEIVVRATRDDGLIAAFSCLVIPIAIIVTSSRKRLSSDKHAYGLKYVIEAFGSYRTPT